MKLFQIYKSKTYLLRLLLSMTVLTAVVLIGSSVSLYYTSERSIIDMQQEFNISTLAQINYNISFMEEASRNMITSLFWNTDYAPLMANNELLSIDLVNTVRKLSAIVSTSSFLDSIVVYNGHKNEMYGGGNIQLSYRESEPSKRLLQFLQEESGVQKLKLIPMNLSDKADGIDVFSYILYESLGAYSAKESAMILNIKPEWLFNNMALINNLAVEQQGVVVLMNGEGDTLRPVGAPAIDTEPFRQPLVERIAHNASSGFFLLEEGHSRKILSYSATMIPGWYAVSVQPYSSIVRNIDRIRETSVGLSVAFLLLSVAASFVVSRRLYKPIERLLGQIKQSQWMSGDQTGRDELTVLSTAYAKVVEHLHNVEYAQRGNRDIVRDYHFKALLTESMTIGPEQFARVAEWNAPRIRETGPYIVLLIAIDGIRSWNQWLQPHEIKLFHFAILNIAEETISSRYPCMGVEMRTDHIAFLLCPGRTAEGNEAEFAALFRRIQDTVHAYYKITISMSVSERVAHYADITRAYQAAQRQMKYKLVFGRQSLITPGMVERNIRNTGGMIPPELEKDLVQGIRLGKMEPLEHTLDILIRHISGVHHDQMVTALARMSDLIRQTLKEINLNRVQPIGIDPDEMDVHILESDTLEDIHRLLWKTLYDICEQNKKGSPDRNDMLVEAIKEIVKQNYSDLNLSLQSISVMLKLSADYVGRIFRKSEMMSVADYIVDVRLNEARRILENEDCSMGDIMDKIGIPNKSYFFKIFKQKIGCTPGEYRLKHSLPERQE